MDQFDGILFLVKIIVLHSFSEVYWDKFRVFGNHFSTALSKLHSSVQRNRLEKKFLVGIKNFLKSLLDIRRIFSGFLAWFFPLCYQICVIRSQRNFRASTSFQKKSITLSDIERTIFGLLAETLLQGGLPKPHHTCPDEHFEVKIFHGIFLLLFVHWAKNFLQYCGVVKNAFKVPSGTIRGSVFLQRNYSFTIYLGHYARQFQLSGENFCPNFGKFVQVAF